MDVFKGISDFAQQQIDCIECRKYQKILNNQITTLKNFVAKHKPNRLDYPKSPDGSRRFNEDFKVWDDLMRL
jgi:hypothetical protein